MADNELNFELDRSPNGTDTWTALTSPAANAVTAVSSGLTVDTTYYYRLRAVNASGNSAYVTANGLTTAGVTSTPNMWSGGFEDATMPSLSTTVDVGGFAYEGSNTVNIVTQVGADNNSVWPSVFTNTTTAGDWTARTGSYSLLFDYSVGNFQSEQRFSFNPTNEIWLRYWIKVPENFTHSSTSPSNMKFLALWMNAEADYSSGGEGSTVAWEFWDDGSSGSEISFHSSDETYSVMGSHLQLTPFISVPADRGRWMQVVAHVKAATTTSSNDGIIEFHRRWDGESTFTQLHYTNTADIGVPAGKSAFAWGYFMGYSNPSYAASTFWRIDDIEVSTGSLL